MQTRTETARFVNSIEQTASELQAASLRGDSLAADNIRLKEIL